MASNDSADNDSARDNFHNNPFIAFRRLVDDQLASAIRALNEQAGISSSPARSITSDTPDEALSPLFNIFAQPPLHGLAMARRHDHQQEKDHELVRPHLWSCVMKHPGRDGAMQHVPCEEGSYNWWRQFSPYSPLNLDGQESLWERKRGGLNWNHAFLDLLAIHNGESMSSPQPSRSEDIYQLFQSEDSRRCRWACEHPVVWGPLTLLAPRLLGPTSSTQTPRRAETEEDMYNAFLNQTPWNGQTQESDKQEQATTSKILGMLQSASNEESERDPSEARHIVSMVTTSHTTTMPDGSVRSVRRFKKTFADGTEESSEDIQDRHPPANSVAQPESGDRKERKGWFWS